VTGEPVLVGDGPYPDDASPGPWLRDETAAPRRVGLARPHA
jgi:hypothetical protein